MGTHSLLSPSGASRWLQCPGSLTLTGLEDTASEYAAQGTAAHELANRCWLVGSNPSVYLGEIWEVDGYQILIDAEMVENVAGYIDFLWTEFGAYHCFTEQKIAHSAIVDFGGTVDFISPDSPLPAIVDFKYGAGVAVEAEENIQLGCYAILKMNLLGVEFPEVELIIFQPRDLHGEKVKRWVAPLAWLKDLERQIEAVSMGQRETEFLAGAHCRWCPAKLNCPVLFDLTQIAAQNEFSKGELTFAGNPIEMTPRRAADIMALRKSAETLFDAVDQWAHGQAEKGVEIPGYKLVQRVGHRRYTDEAKAVRWLKKLGLGVKDLYEKSLISPAQVEKKIPKENKKLAADTLAAITEKPVLGSALVPDTDKRPALTRLTAETEFVGVTYE